MQKVLWITDGVNWGWDIRANAIGSRTPYEHVITTFKDKCYMELKEEIEELNPDVIMVFAPAVVDGIPEYMHERVVLCLSGFRTLQDPETIDKCQFLTR